MKLSLLISIFLLPSATRWVAAEVGSLRRLNLVPREESARPQNIRGTSLEQLQEEERQRLDAENNELFQLILQSQVGSFDTSSPPLVPSPSAAPVTAAPSTSTPTVGEAPAVCESLLWSDEFDTNGSPDDSIWSFDLGTGEGGWGNMELQQYTDENVSVRDGSLIIAAAAAAQADGSNQRAFTSGRIRTEDKLEVLYGNIEARIKFPPIRDGLWPAFWSLGGNFREAGWPASGEIDIMETGSASAIADGAIHRRVISATHRENGGIQASVTAAYDLPYDFTNGEFHIFRLEWTSTRIKTFVDDNLVLDMDITPDGCSDCSEFHQPHFLLLNMAVGGFFTGIFDEAGITAALPAALLVDYVRVCDNGETVLSGSAIENAVEHDFDCGATDTCTTSALNNYAKGVTCGARIASLISGGMSEESACKQIAGIEFPAECGSCIAQVLDCGLETCTNDALEANAGGSSCRDRISFLVAAFGLTEIDACNRIGGQEFPVECGACNPIDCGNPETCTSAVLDTDAGGATCGERIQFLIGNGSTETSACKLIAGQEFPNECGPCNIIDCDTPTTCTTAVLNTDANGSTCGDRISFLITVGGLSEADACRQIGEVEFPEQCGQCASTEAVGDIRDCGLPETCTKEVLDTDADGYSCGARIDFLVGSMGFSEADACAQVGSVEFPSQCAGCGPTSSLDCGVPGTCTTAVLDADAGGFPCGNRISFLISSMGMDEAAACAQVGEEFPVECAGCDPTT